MKLFAIAFPALALGANIGRGNFGIYDDMTDDGLQEMLDMADYEARMNFIAALDDSMGDDDQELMRSSRDLISWNRYRNTGRQGGRYFAKRSMANSIDRAAAYLNPDVAAIVAEVQKRLEQARRAKMIRSFQ